MVSPYPLPATPTLPSGPLQIVWREAEGYHTQPHQMRYCSTYRFRVCLFRILYSFVCNSSTDNIYLVLFLPRAIVITISNYTKSICFAIHGMETKMLLSCSLQKAPPTIVLLISSFLSNFKTEVNDELAQLLKNHIEPIPGQVLSQLVSHLSFYHIPKIHSCACDILSIDVIQESLSDGSK